MGTNNDTVSLIMLINFIDKVDDILSPKILQRFVSATIEQQRLIMTITICTIVNELSAN
jgi:hypothetical protein